MSADELDSLTAEPRNAVPSTGSGPDLKRNGGTHITVHAAA